jgi:acetyltransferase
MSTYHLDRLFDPRSVALVGASPRQTSVGRTILSNLRLAGFAGRLHLVNPIHGEVEGIRSVKSIADLPEVPDVVIITAPPPQVPGIIAAAGAKGIPTAVVIAAGLGHGPGSLSEAAERAARASGMRLIGPNCLGVLVPPANLNASFAARMPQAGDLALISQSGAIAAGLVEWAAKWSVGFSAIVSLGDQLDVDFADLLDHFAVDRNTRAILLYVESISDARKFMSAARAAARVKPVVVIKAGRHTQGAVAARTHTGALAGSDAVYDAAFRRAGMLRVLDLDELFAAAATLGYLQPFRGNRLAILTNGGGIGVLAVDRLMDLGGTLAILSPTTMNTLDKALPPIWSRANPVDIAGDADAHRYAVAMEALLTDRDNDAILVMNVPTALASAAGAAKSVATAVRENHGRFIPPKPVLAVWVGESGQAAAELETANIPHFPSETDAVRGFMHLVRYREAIDHLMAMPPSLPQDFTPDVTTARRIINGVIAAKRTWLDPVEVSGLCAAYAIPLAALAPARNADEAAAAARPLLANGGAVAVKIHSPDIVHKSDIGGVRLSLASEQAVRDATADVLAQARAAKPDARIAGVTIHPMIVRPRARELIAGIADDPTFGPIVVFGSGGTAVEVIDDKAIGVPPLDMKLAQDLIARTRVSRLLKGYRDVPAADGSAVAALLVKLAQLAADLPEVREVDLNPLLADETGVIAVDARVAVAPVVRTRQSPPGHPRFAIRPYPKEWESYVKLKDGSDIFVRPIRPEDEELYPPFLSRVSQEDLQLRFFAPVKQFDHVFIARFTQLDYARAMAFVTIDKASGEMTGVGRLHANSNYDTAEFAVLVRSDLKGRGVGWLLMQTIIEYARSEGLKTIEGQVLNENTTMLRMCTELGFTAAADPKEPNISVVRLSLEPKIERAHVGRSDGLGGLRCVNSERHKPA